MRSVYKPSQWEVERRGVTLAGTLPATSKWFFLLKTSSTIRLAMAAPREIKLVTMTTESAFNHAFSAKRKTGSRNIFGDCYGSCAV